MFHNRWIPQLRPLEDRALPSTTVTIVQDTLRIRGDSMSNIVQLSALGSQVSVICDQGPVQTFEGIHQIVADLGGGDDRFQAVRVPATSPNTVQQPLILDLSTGAGHDVVILEWAPGAQDSIQVELGAGDDLFDGRFIPPPDPDVPTAITFRASVQGGAGLDRITSRMGIEPTPFSPQVTYEFLADGGAGDDVVSAEVDVRSNAQQGGSLPPVAPSARFVLAVNGGAGNDDVSARMGIEPTPFLPTMDFHVSVNGGADNDIMAVNTSIDPAELVGFNLQTEPPVVNVTVSMNGGAGLDRITSRMGIEPTPFRPPVVDFDLRMDGGDGNDLLDAQFASGPTQQPVANVRMVLLGGAGNDTLRALWPLSAFDVAAVADGGAGYDSGEFSPGLRFVNMEKIV